MIEKAFNKEFWASFRDEEHKQFKEELKAQYKKIYNAPLPVKAYSEFKSFYATGHRNDPTHVSRRRLLTIATHLALIEPENDEYINCVQDVLWAVCDEFSWVIPAHLHEPENFNKIIIDLYSAQTALQLCEITRLLEDRLDVLVIKRVLCEVYKRVIEPYLNSSERWFWETARGNWAAVCGGCIGIAIMTSFPNLFEQARPKLEQTMQTFLESYCDDGICLEGASYWRFGFGHFVFYAEELYRFTDGKKNYFALPLVKNISRFAEIAWPSKDIVVPFADALVDQCKYDRGLYSVLKSVYGSKIGSFTSNYFANNDYHFNWAYSIRNTLYFKKEYLTTIDVKRFDTYCGKNSGWFVKNATKYILFAKAGHNEEPHNHNDVGSFMLASNGAQVLCDLGGGEYTKNSFKAERYNFFWNCSGGHNLPIIDGTYQSPGKKFDGKITETTDGCIIDFKNAYDINSLKQLRRKFVLNENDIYMSDIFSFSEGKHAVTERFILRAKPTITPGRIAIDNVEILFDGTEWGVSTTKEIFVNHIKQKSDVYCVNITKEDISDLSTFKAHIIIKDK